MKKILFPCLIASLLAACASDKGPVDESKFKKKESAVKKNDKSVQPTRLMPVENPADCVTLEGSFKRPSDAKEGLQMNLATKRETDKASYSYETGERFSDKFIAADGQANEIDGAKVMLVCSKTAIEYTYLKDDKVSRLQLELVDAKTLKVTGEGSVLDLVGTYTKIEAAPAPAPGEDEDDTL
jgi:hypothetical protein